MNKHRILLTCLTILFLLCLVSCNASGRTEPEINEVPESEADRNIIRSMELVDAAIENYFSKESMSMARYYNPYTGAASFEKGSVWMYTSAIEAVNAILEAINLQKSLGDTELYDLHYDRYCHLLGDLYDGAQYYKGSFELVSYTQTKTWSVYAVDRAGAPGTADVSGVLNVYDDQQWLVRELINSYHLTGEEKYLQEAEYLSSYILDGWDCTLDNFGKECGGITWGPGYVSKHSCSNGPFVSPLVWLHEIYKDKEDTITYRYIEKDKSRVEKTVKKSDYYLDFAKKVYAFQRDNLKRDDGVYDDMLAGDDSGGKVVYEEINGQTYRKHTSLFNRVGPAYSYNSGTMLSGAADLYRVTKEGKYLSDLQNLVAASFKYFADKDAEREGYYSYDISGFGNWFNGVLFRGYVDAYPFDIKAGTPIQSFQDNLDYAWDNHKYGSMLPNNLLLGWGKTQSMQRIEAMFTFAYAAEYAVLARYKTEY